MDTALDHRTFLSLILGGDRCKAERYTSRIFEEQGAAYLYEQVIQPALHEVGQLWRADRISVADEHLATTTTQSAVAALYAQFPWPTGGPRVLVGCAQGERHEVGARMVADLLALHGWDELFLGADVPVEHFARKVRDVAPKVVAISVTLQAHVPMVRALIHAVRHARPEAKILVGGLATASLPSAEAVGADAIAERGSEAIELTRRWDSGITTVIHDVSTRRELERLREEWAAIVAHDLRQPVHAIALAADLLLQLHAGEPPAAVERRTIERIRSASTRLNRMISDLSDAAQIESRRLSMKPKLVDIGVLVESVLEDLDELRASHSLRLEVEGDRLAWVDPDRIRQVLENLLSNAAKYGAKGTELRIEVITRDDVVEVILTNRGPGIAPDLLPFLFSRFARARGARESGRPGLGLGLYIAKGLVEAHCGRLWAESVPGETTSFHFTVPRRQDAPRAEAGCDVHSAG